MPEGARPPLKAPLEPADHLAGRETVHRPVQHAVIVETFVADVLLLEEGTDSRSGARHLKRAIERHLVFPLSNLLATDQIQFGDLVTIDYDSETSKLIFLKENPGAPGGVSKGASATEPVLAFASGVSASTSRVWTSDAEDRMAG